jgi:hypothetical protein
MDWLRRNWGILAALSSYLLLGRPTSEWALPPLFPDDPSSGCSAPSGAKAIGSLHHVTPSGFYNFQAAYISSESSSTQELMPYKQDERGPPMSRWRRLPMRQNAWTTLELNP